MAAISGFLDHRVLQPPGFPHRYEAGGDQGPQGLGPGQCHLPEPGHQVRRDEKGFTIIKEGFRGGVPKSYDIVPVRYLYRAYPIFAVWYLLNGTVPYEIGAGTFLGCEFLPVTEGLCTVFVGAEVCLYLHINSCKF